MCQPAFWGAGERPLSSSTRLHHSHWAQCSQDPVPFHSRLQAGAWVLLGSSAAPPRTFHSVRLGSPGNAHGSWVACSRLLKSLASCRLAGVSYTRVSWGFTSARWLQFPCGFACLAGNSLSISWHRSEGAGGDLEPEGRAERRAAGARRGTPAGGEHHGGGGPWGGRMGNPWSGAGGGESGTHPGVKFMKTPTKLRKWGE